jgi:predicted alpha/beta-fold hydrolase
VRRHYAVGVSLGGNALLKWLGERESPRPSDCLHAAAAISAPLDLAACGHHLARGFNRVYTKHFLHTPEAQRRRKLRRYPGLFDERRMRAAKNLYEFDDVVTAPLHGFAGADDYWRRASSKPWLRRHPAADAAAQRPERPFPAAQALPAASQVAASVQLELPAPGRTRRFRHRQPAGATRLAAATHPSLLPARGLT